MPSEYYTSYIPFITATPKEDFIPVGNTNRQKIAGGKLLPTSSIVLYIAETIKNRTIPFVLVWFCFMLFNLSNVQAQSAETRAAEGQQRILVGEVRSSTDQKAIEGVSLRSSGGSARTDKEGKFRITISGNIGKLEVRHIGFQPQSINFNADTKYLEILLDPTETQIEEVEVVSTGYQQIPKERATGSFEFVDSALFNRKVSTDFVSRLEDVVPSIGSNKTIASNRGKLLNINVRGLSTMRSERWPLVVVDGVPYPNNFDALNGYFNNINPNDIENVTMLKDAAASSIWGAQSGNGVIVITTKRAKYNQPFQLSINSNVTVSQKPDLYYYPQMGSSDYIDLEKQLFDAGYWDSRMNEYYVGLTPVIQMLKEHKAEGMSDQELKNLLDGLRNSDVRPDYLKYIYRPSVNQQYSLQARGGGEKVNTSFSIGYDDNRESLVTASFSRLTARNNTQLRPIKNLTVDIGITYTESKKIDSEIPMGYNMMNRNYPYMRLADEEGNPLVVDAVSNNPTFRDTVAGGRLLDWRYRPLAELYETSESTQIKETFFNVKTAYQILPSLRMDLLYAYQQASQPTEQWRGIGSFQQREFINYHTSWDEQNVTWNIPVGDYLNVSHRYNTHQQGRALLDFSQRWKGMHELNAIVGMEVRAMQSNMMASVFQGYDPETLAFQPVKYGLRVPALNCIAGTVNLIDYSHNDAYENRYISYFGNASYTYLDRYVLSGSVRRDASNLFGVRTNDRGQPFWSIGGSWLLSNEAFMYSSWLTYLKIRATYGYNGNVNNRTAAYAIMNVASSPHSITGLPYATMQSPPNPNLRWERVGMFNAGVDFATKDNRVSGSLEYYVKHPKDLIATTQIDPTTGFNSLNINSAHLEGKGVDVTLQTQNIKGDQFNWTSNLVFAYNRTKVLQSFISSDRATNFIDGAHGRLITPIEGMDLYSLLTYKWAGLDPMDGTPRGYIDGEISKDYAALVNSSTVDDLENHGSVIPLYFGSFRNSLRYRKLEFSFNIAYQLGHKFLRQSFDNRMFIDNGVGHADFAQRWQKTGDEQHTDVPAFTYPNNLYASQLYSASSALVESASHIKLRDLQLSYNLPNLSAWRIRNARVYAYAQNVGMIWKTNKQGIDPEYGSMVPDPFALSLGVNLNF